MTSLAISDSDSWQIHHPWLGHLFIQAPGFNLPDRPYITGVELLNHHPWPLPVTLSEPSFYITDDGYRTGLYHQGYVAFITTTSMTAVLPCRHVP